MYSEIKLKQIERLLKNIKNRCVIEITCDMCNMCPTITGLIAEIRTLRKRENIMLEELKSVSGCNVCAYFIKGVKACKSSHAIVEPIRYNVCEYWQYQGDANK